MKVLAKVSRINPFVSQQRVHVINVQRCKTSFQGLYESRTRPFPAQQVAWEWGRRFPKQAPSEPTIWFAPPNKERTKLCRLNPKFRGDIQSNATPTNCHAQNGF